MNPSDETEPFDRRARSYLHANCAHCHRFGGGGGQVVLELDFSKPLKETASSTLRPRQGDFGMPDARIVAPGDPHRSVLFYRMAKFGRGRMPHLGSEWPDEEGLDLMDGWICSLGNPSKKPTPLPQSADAAGHFRQRNRRGIAIRSHARRPEAAAVDEQGSRCRRQTRTRSGSRSL